MLTSAALILIWAMQTPAKIDPPAADSAPLAFFLRAAEPRKATEGLDQAAGDTLIRAVRFLLKDAGIENNAIRDEQGRKVPPYLYHAVIDDDDHFSYRISYPAFHHPYLIEAFLDYYNYTGDEEGIRRARQLADWTIEHSTPADWKWPYLPWSTFSEGKPGGLEDKDNLQPDKVGYAGLSYTRLYEVTGDAKYLEAARHAADTLVAQQGFDGSWPFRVNPQTGKVERQYTAALFFNVAFLEKMYSLTGEKDYKNAQLTAWMWMQRNPIRTGNWSGLYEDIPSGADSQVHYSPLQTIRLLLRYRTPANESSYLAKAKKLFDDTMDGLAFDDPEMGLIVREQTYYLAATPSATMNWSMMAAEFFLATGEEKYRYTTLEAVRMVTKYGLKPDGRSHNTVVGGRIYGDGGSWYSLTSPIVRYLYQDMGCLPELAPSNETHLLRTSTQIRAIDYREHTVNYRTLENSVDLLKLKSAPSSVTAAGKTLKSSPKLDHPDTYFYNPASKVLLVRHQSPDVKVTLHH
jgi:hypothetical protein